MVVTNAFATLRCDSGLQLLKSCLRSERYIIKLCPAKTFKLGRMYPPHGLDQTKIANQAADRLPKNFRLKHG